MKNLTERWKIVIKTILAVDLFHLEKDATLKSSCCFPLERNLFAKNLFILCKKVLVLKNLVHTVTSFYHDCYIHSQNYLLFTSNHKCNQNCSCFPKSAHNEILSALSAQQAEYIRMQG